MSIQLLVDAAEFWPAFLADARTATSRLFIQVLTFEADDVGRQVGDLLLELGNTVDRRMIVDHYTRYFINDRFLYAPNALRDRVLWREARDTVALLETLQQNGVSVHWTNPIGIRLHRLAARNHKKIFIIDDRVAYIGGLNLSDHNFAWHDLMLRVDDPALVACLADDVLGTTQGRNQVLDRTFDEGRLLILDGTHGKELLKDVFDRIENAREEVFVESPYVSEPFFNPMGTAAARGRRVINLVPELNNWGWYDAYVRVECFRRGLELHYYRGQMNHLKAMLIDGEVLVTGSCNFDYFAYNGHQELVFVTSNAALVEDFKRRVYAPDLANARRATLDGQFTWQTHWTSIRVRTGYPVLKWFNLNV